jgi:hypothetical protein
MYTGTPVCASVRKGMINKKEIHMVKDAHVLIVHNYLTT